MSIDKIELCGAVLSKELKSFIDKESKVWVHLIGEYFPKRIFFLSQLLVPFQGNKRTRSVGH